MANVTTRYEKCFPPLKFEGVVYMAQPPGFMDHMHPNYVCHLNCSIYGLKQAPWAWFDRFTLYLLCMRFFCSQADSTLLILHSSQGIVVLLLYVDDIILTTNNETFLQNIINSLSKEFAMKDLRKLHYFLGIEISYFPSEISLSQAKYSRDILLRVVMLEALSISTPLAIKDNNTSLDATLVYATTYRNIVSALQYLISTCIDITHIVNRVCQFMEASTIANF